MRAAALATALLLSGCGDGCGGAPPAPEVAAPVEAPAARPRKRSRAERRFDAPTLVLVVLDTVRADHTSLCGYERPTTPYLETLGKRAGPVTYTCAARTPGTWTVPSHASMFTGRTVAEHGSDAMDRPMAADLPTLAEQLGERGYQSLLVSANPTLNQRSGLQRGFDEAVVAGNLTAWRGADLDAVLRNALERLARDKPLFLVLNIFDAHDPFPEIPLDVAWLTPRDALVYDPHPTGREGTFQRYLRGELPRDEATAYEQAVKDGYDYGVARADQNLRLAMTTLRATGWLEGPFRLVVTSDHGEFLGDKGMLRHGCFPWEPVTRVPLLVYEPGREQPLDLPDPISTTQVFHLLRDGALGADVPVVSMSEARVTDPRPCADAVALWTDEDRKLVARAGEVVAYDLDDDPGERRPSPAAGQGVEQLRALAEAHAAHRAEVRKGGGDARRREEMEALGYVE
ncbi:MAG: sulfatase-like hydrolase/transferase [Alphaproteobacteria bacterium]|nr:sulfatase-like hydrolase/transferase [Alphaproteobacteria bacterium]